jgi:hypothetical protein
MALNDKDKRIERRYKRADKKLEKANAKGPDAYAKANKKYGYDYESAKSAGITPDSTGHWPSRNPQTGQILKGRKHPTINMTKKGEREAGYKVYKKDGILYSKPKKSTLKKGL